MMSDLVLGALLIAVLAAPVFAYALYKRWLYGKDVGVHIAPLRLENRVQSYTGNGFSREEAVKKLRQSADLCVQWDSEKANA